jgi:hypothetical protein
MKSKLVEAGKPLEVEIPFSGGVGSKKLSLTIVEEISAGKDRRVYKVKDQHDIVYVYKYMKKRTLQKEVERAEAVAKAGVSSARLIASGRVPEERSNGYVLREWIDGVRGDTWIQRTHDCCRYRPSCSSSGDTCSPRSLRRQTGS